MDTLAGKVLINKEGKKIRAEDALKNINVILYFFGADWCCQCSVFIPKLKQVYTEAKRRRIPLEVVYVPVECNEKEMMEGYFKSHGGWFVMVHGDIAIQELKNKYDVTGIPMLIVVTREGTKVTANGRKEIECLGVNVLVTWI